MPLCFVFGVIWYPSSPSGQKLSVVVTVVPVVEDTVSDVAVAVVVVPVVAVSDVVLNVDVELVALV